MGISTSLVKFVCPFFNGHSKPTLLICSHKSASWLINLIRPYLTCRSTLAPSSTSSLNIPEASMVRVWPL